MLLDLTYIANSYRDESRNDSAFYYYESAEKISIKTNDRKGLSDIYAQKTKTYCDLKQYDKAFDYYTRIGECYEDSKGGIYTIGAILYSAVGMRDSSIIYWQKVLEYGNFYSKVGAYSELANIAMSIGDTKQATEYINAYMTYADSARNVMYAEALTNLKHIYNYHHKEKQISQLEISTIQKSRQIWAILCLFTLFIFILCAVIRHLRIKQQNAQLQIMRYRQLEETIAKQSCGNAITHADKAVDNTMGLKIMNKIEALLKEDKLLSLTDWEEIIIFLNMKYPKFILSLKELRLLNETDMQISMLLKLKLSPMNIAKLIGREKSTISVTRRRLYKKTFGKDGTPKDWDLYIDSL